MAHQRLLLQRPGQHPFGQGADVAGLLGHGNEAVGHDQAPGGMAPADQHLHARDGVLAQVQLGLVVQDHLTPVQAVEHLAHQRQVRGGIAIELRIEDGGLHPRGAGLVQRDGGPLDDGRDEVVVLALQGQADGEADIDGVVAEAERRLKLGQ